MEVNLFQFDANELHLRWLKRNVHKGRSNIATLEELLKHTSLSFSVEGSSRIATHEIVESDDSYTQQSQRYVAYEDDFGFVTPFLPEHLKKEYLELSKEMFNLYKKMTLLKEDRKDVTRPSVDDYVHGIPIEDGRYILPLSAKSNLLATIPGSEITDFMRQMYHQPFDELNNELYKSLLSQFGKISPFLRNRLEDAVNESYINNNQVRQLNEELFVQIKEKVVLLNSTTNGIVRCGLGASTSTKEKGPSKIYEKWIEKGGLEYAVKRASEIAKQVSGVGHVSIFEHYRRTFGLKVSAVCYHQLVRHRVREISRPMFNDTPQDFGYIIPPSIKNSSFEQEYIGLIEKSRQLYGKLKNENCVNAPYILPNALELPVVLTANDRALAQIIEERTCNRAQWEIRDIAQKMLYISNQENSLAYQKAGPKCVYGACPEGKLSCGKSIEMKSRYGRKE